MGVDIALYFVVALAIGAFCKVKNFNPALPLIAAGFVADLFNRNLAAMIDPEHVMMFLLAPLVFAAGLNSSALDLRKVRRSVIFLAVVLVVVSAVVVGVVASLALAGMSFGVAFSLGAILAPTDAVAASAVARKVRLPRRVLLIIEGESLTNDGTALTVLRIATVIVVAGGVSAAQAVGIAGLAIFGGIVVGVVGGWFVTKLIGWVGDPTIGNVIGLITPFVLYAVAEEIEGSGLLAVVIAGIWIAQVTSLQRTSHTFRLQGKSIWNTVTFLLETVTFYVVGAEFVSVWESIKRPNVGLVVVTAIGVTVLMFLLRLGFTLLMSGYVYKVNSDNQESWRELKKGAIAISILGVRGPVSVLAALAIPFTVANGDPFPDRGVVIAITFVSVILSLLAATTAGWFVKRLKFQPEPDIKILAQARASLNNAALVRLDEIQADGIDRHDEIPAKIIETAREQYSRKLRYSRAIRDDDKDLVEKNLQRKAVAREVLKAQYQELGRLQVREGLPGDLARILSTELDHNQSTLR